MKKVILILAVAALASCQKQSMQENESEETPNTCAVVSDDAVPTVVQNAFMAKYPQNTAEKWFNKDDQGFSAVFTQSGSKMLAQFDNDGTFRTEVSAPVSNPPTGTQPPPPGNHPPQGQCGGHHPHHKPHGFIPMMHHKKHHECSCHNDEKKKDCQVVLTQ